MKLFIDGDACPVKDEVIDLAKELQKEVVIVTSTPHFSTKVYPDFVEVIYVDSGADAADFRIVKLISHDDILITQDYGLASLVLPKCQAVFHHTGMQYTENNIDNLLETRYQSARIRKSGGRTKGPKPFSAEQRQNFKAKLASFLKTC